MSPSHLSGTDFVCSFSINFGMIIRNRQPQNATDTYLCFDLADEHQTDLGHLAQTILTYEGYASNSCRTVAPGDVTTKFIHSSLMEPVFVPPGSRAVQQLGMVLPAPASLTVPEIAKALEYEREVCFNLKL